MEGQLDQDQSRDPVAEYRQQTQQAIEEKPKNHAQEDAVENDTKPVYLTGIHLIIAMSTVFLSTLLAALDIVSI